MAVVEQLELGFDGKRRRRKGAGRPRKVVGRSPHEARPEVSRLVPVHVVMRVVSDVGRLRGPGGYGAVRRGIGAVMARDGFRIVHVSVQSNHVHLIVEADGKRELANGLRAFMISTARALNRAVGRRGAVFATRYHATPLRTPRQVRAALAYVMNNWRHHGEDQRGAAQRRAAIDPYATGLVFDGWRDPPARFELPGGYEPLPVAGARTWLLTVGWRQHHPLIGVREVPG